MLNILVVEDNKYRNNAHDNVITCTIGIPTPSLLTQYILFPKYVDR